MTQYSQSLLDDIRGATDIVDLVGRFVNLRKAGTGWKGLCPFHAEKTPSFTVNPRKGIYHCFGCGVGGDAFGFLMRQDRVSFPEAVRARRASTRASWRGRLASGRAPTSSSAASIPRSPVASASATRPRAGTRSSASCARRR
jgi:CHC2 zinc finger